MQPPDPDPRYSLDIFASARLADTEDRAALGEEREKHTI
jgi:hypothetical protein